MNWEFLKRLASSRINKAQNTVRMTDYIENRTMNKVYVTRPA